MVLACNWLRFVSVGSNRQYCMHASTPTNILLRTYELARCLLLLVWHPPTAACPSAARLQPTRRPPVARPLPATWLTALLPPTASHFQHTWHWIYLYRCTYIHMVHVNRIILAFIAVHAERIFKPLTGERLIVKL